MKGLIFAPDRALRGSSLLSLGSAQSTPKESCGERAQRPAVGGRAASVVLAACAPARGAGAEQRVGRMTWGRRGSSGFGKSAGRVFGAPRGGARVAQSAGRGCGWCGHV